MKKYLLIAVMSSLLVFVIVFWAATLVSDVSLSLFLYTIGRLFALSGFIFVFFQFVFSSKIKWIERGIGLDKLIILHRKSGVIGFSLILLHPLFLLASDVFAGRPLSMPVPKLIGILALFVFIIAVSSAILYNKLHLKYEIWKAMHWTNYAALIFAFVHSLFIGSDLSKPPLRTLWFILACLYGMILLHKLLLYIRIRKHPYQISAVIQETHDTWSLFFSGMDIQYKPGQFLIVQLIRNDRVSEPHPFTLSSSPTQNQLSITVKSVGDFTSTIGNTTIEDKAIIDAPYGMFSFLNYDAQELVFIAGGIGVTPFISMLRYIREKKLQRKVLLIWGNKTERDITFRNELEEIANAVTSLQVVHVLSSQNEWQGEKGYVDTHLLSKYLTEMNDPQIFICGPPVMMTKILQSLSELQISNKSIHYERFALR